MSKSEIKSGVVLSYIILVMSNIISIFYTPIVLKYLGQSEYGIYNLSGSIIGYLSIISMGLGSTVIRYISRQRVNGDFETESKLNGAFFIIYNIMAIIAVFMGVIMILCSNNIFKASMTIAEISEIKIILIILVIDLAGTLSCNLFGSVLIAYEKFKLVKLISLVSIILTPLITLPLIFIGFKAIMIAVVNTVINFTTILIYIYYFFFKLKKRIVFSKIDKELKKDMIKYTSFIALGVIIDRIYWGTDQFILGMVSGSISVAVYSVGATFAQYYVTFSTSISGLFTVKVANLVDMDATNDDLTALLIKVGRIQFFILALILTGFILFGKQFIYFWAGKDYALSYYVALLIMIPSTIPLIQNIALNIIQAKNKHGFRSVVYAVIALLNIVATYFLAKIWGVLGAAAATCCAYVIGQIIIMNIYYNRKIGLNMVLFWKEIFKLCLPIIVCFSIGILITYSIDTFKLLNLLVSVLIYMCVYIILFFLFGMNKYEKELFIGFVRKVFIFLPLGFK
jgi:O-antigen/teichoic acid export membrane protein